VLLPSHAPRAPRRAVSALLRGSAAFGALAGGGGAVGGAEEGAEAEGAVPRAVKIGGGFAYK